MKKIQIPKQYKEELLERFNERNIRFGIKSDFSDVIPLPCPLCSDFPDRCENKKNKVCFLKHFGNAFSAGCLNVIKGFLKKERYRFAASFYHNRIEWDSDLRRRAKEEIKTIRVNLLKKVEWI